MGAGPIYEQIARNVRRLIARGDLPPGSRLPSARDLAATLSVNPNTVVHAYQELERSGTIETRRGRGSFVRDDAPVTGMRNDMLVSAARVYAEEARRLGASTEEAVATLKEVQDAGSA
jgi:GntR family transcriptional regulator